VRACRLPPHDRDHISATVSLVRIGDRVKKDEGRWLNRLSSFVFRPLDQLQPNHTFVRRSQPALSTWQ
jgi:hypothetical protein